MTKQTLTRAAGALLLTLLVFMTTACIPNFNVPPLAADASQRIRQAITDSKQVNGAKAKATIFAKAYCELRAKYPAAIERIRGQLQAVVPAIAVAATKALIDGGCDKLTPDSADKEESANQERTANWQWREPGIDAGSVSLRALRGTL